MKALFLLALILVATPLTAHHLSACLDSSPNACKCVTAECAAGLRPATPHKVSYEEACVVAGTAACVFIAAKKPKNFKKVFSQCQVAKTAACIAACK